MGTLMQLETQRCDASCYNAKHTKCDCCCGGMNHGKGEKKAIRITNNYKKSLERQGITWYFGFNFSRKPIQPSLFD